MKFKDFILTGVLAGSILSAIGCDHKSTFAAPATVSDEVAIATQMDSLVIDNEVAVIPSSSLIRGDVYKINTLRSAEQQKNEKSSIADEHAIVEYSEDKQTFECLIEPHEISEVATSISGVLEEVIVGRGDRVQQGQIIARLRSNVEKANVDLARAELKFRERNYRRWQEMNEQSYASNVEKDQAENLWEIARYELERAEQILNERIIRSPFSGVVVEQYLSVGELSEDRKIFKLAKIDILNVEVIAPVHMLGKVSKGMRAKVYPEGPVTGPFWASVTVVDPIIDAASGTLGMRFELPNTDYQIPAGVRCSVDFQDLGQ